MKHHFIVLMFNPNMSLIELAHAPEFEQAVRLAHAYVVSKPNHKFISRLGWPLYTAWQSKSANVAIYIVIDERVFISNHYHSLTVSEASQLVRKPHPIVIASAKHLNMVERLQFDDEPVYEVLPQPRTPVYHEPKKFWMP